MKKYNLFDMLQDFQQQMNAKASVELVRKSEKGNDVGEWRYSSTHS
jgi:hypothetical protein